MLTTLLIILVIVLAPLAYLGVCTLRVLWPVLRSDPDTRDAFIGLMKTMTDRIDQMTPAQYRRFVQQMASVGRS